MTGQLFAATPPHRLSMAYSIDSFSEYSATAVSRTPTRAVVAPSTSVSFNTNIDEELFRDLFVDADADDAAQRDLVFGSKLTKGNPTTTPSKKIVWHTGATLTKPFATSPSTQSRNNQIPTAFTTAPSLSTPLPRQNAVDLMTTRPPATSVEDDPASELGLPRVPEVNEEDEDDEAERVTNLKKKSKSARHVLDPLTPRTSLLKPGSNSVHNDTLQFLEKLDLKSLLAQPRPDVTNFLPPGNQVSHALEDDNTKRPAASLAANSVNNRKPLSSRKDPLHPLPEGASRLAHMAQMYGTATAGPRKARMETLERLSNPISGHTSTLQALSPESRRKREAESGTWPPRDTATNPVKTLTSRKTKELIERLSEAQSNYTPSSARAGAKRIKETKLVKVAIRGPTPRSDIRNPAISTGKVGSVQSRSNTLDERKALLKQKLASRVSIKSEPSGMTCTSTFLTQLEDSEAKLSKSTLTFRRSNRKLVALRDNDSKPVGELRQCPQRPVVPPSVRTRLSSTAGPSTPPSKNGKQTPVRQNTSRSKYQWNATAVRCAVTTESSQRQSTTRPRKSMTVVDTTKVERKPSQMSKKAGRRAASESSASKLLLGTSTVDILKPRGRSSTTVRPHSPAKVRESRPGTDPAHDNLPLIRRPAPTAPQRPTGVASNRVRRIHTKA